MLPDFAPIRASARRDRLGATVLVALGFVAGCGSTTSPAPQLAGTWSEVTTIPGVRLTMTLTESGTTVAGSGTYAIEAGRSGTLQVSGTDIQPSVALTLQYDYGVVAAFSGSLTDANHLTGTLSYSNDGTGSITFARQ